MSKKPDADAIRAFLEGLPGELGLDPPRRWWPKYIFRSDHVENAARILESGFVLSRTAASHGQVIAVDAGSPQHVSETASADQDHVRLYFRPRTPTQFCNEGIRPRACIEWNAHMPVPVYLLFDSKEVLTESGVIFSRGRLVPAAPRGGSAAFLRSLDFMQVYHDGPVGARGAPGRSDLINARHSEVAVPVKLPLTHLRLVVCRSAAERETLLNLLPEALRPRWVKRISLEGAQRIFFKRATFIQDVALSPTRSRFTFFPSTEGPAWRGPFLLEVKWWDGADWQHSEVVPDFRAGAAPLGFDLPSRCRHYFVRVRLDGNLAYLGKFSEVSRPEVF